MDRIMDHKQMTASWAFWDLENPTDADIEDSRMPSESVSNAPQDDREGVCLSGAITQLTESNKRLSEQVETLSAEIFSLQQIVNQLTYNQK
jgi:hypothetical protein